jgi:fumarate hydratase class II
VSFVVITYFVFKEKVMTTHRSERDSMGAIDVPADKLWGAQTQRSLEHFRISTEKMPGELIYALALTKRAAAKVNQDLGLLTAEKAGRLFKPPMKCWPANIPMNFRWLSGRPVPARKAT